MKIEKMINDMIKKTWDLFKNQYVNLIVGTLVAIFFMIITLGILIPPLIFGIYYMGSKVVKGKQAKITDVFKGLEYFFRSWGLILLYIIIVAVGFALLIIPGLIFLIMFQYIVAVSIMENKGIIDSLKTSWAIAKKNFLFSVVVGILFHVLNIVGRLADVGILVTWLITLPLTAVFMCLAVKKLKR